MSQFRSDSARHRTFIALGAAALLLALSIDRGGPLHAAPPPASAIAHDHSRHMANHEEMARLSEARYRAHPPRGGDVLVNAPPAAAFDVFDFIFDADGNTGTQVDTVHILVGESVRWNWAEGIHTTTADGGEWDAPMDAQNSTFDHTFTAAGLYPFHCVFHAGLNMRGAVDVRSPTAGVTRLTGNSERVGFLLGPSPNPTRAGATFRFALSQAGHARVEVFDVWGRLVAQPLSRDLEPGVYAASWDGRTQTGYAAAPGSYYLRLVVPGAMQSRRVTVIR